MRDQIDLGWGRSELARPPGVDGRRHRYADRCPRRASSALVALVKVVPVGAGDQLRLGRRTLTLLRRLLSRL